MKIQNTPQLRSNLSLKIFVLFLAALVLGVPALQAQQRKNVPHIGYVFPAGVQRGTTCEIVVGGQFMQGAQDLLVSGSGVKVTALKYRKPLSGKRASELRDYIQEARKKAAEEKETPVSLKRFDLDGGITRILQDAGATEDEIMGFMELRKQRNDPKRQPNIQISETVTLTVEVAADAPTGPREVRVFSPSGLSNPLAFCVGRLPEQRKPGPLGKAIDTAMQVALPTVLNGQILPGEVDHYAFQARRGARLVIVVQGRDLIPYLADAVPGWFQPVVALYDAKGREVAYANDYRFSPDPVLCFEVPEEGAYLLELKDALYRGREDFVYRVTVGEIPFVTGIFPLGGRRGTPCAVDVFGWNLPRTRAIVAASEREGMHRVEELSNGFIVGDVAFASDSLPEIREKEPNNDAKEAQQVTLPVIVNGHINAPGDVDVFAFSCNAGDKVVAEVVARRLNSPLDSFLKITDETGLQIAFNDDRDDKGSGLITHQADSYLTFTALASGRYFLTLGDAQHMGGADYSYRLRISPPQPDFAVRLVPSSLNAQPGATVPVTVYALRKDGFLGDITLAFKDAPKGFLLQGGCIPGGQNKVRATVTFPPTAIARPVPLEMESRAVVDGRETVRPVVPADDMLQAFIYHHLVPATAMYAASGGGFLRGAFPRVPTEPVVLVPGGVSPIVIDPLGRAPQNTDELKLQLSDPPEGFSVEGVSVTPAGLTVSVRTSAKAKPGLRGNLLFEAFMERTPPPGKDGKKGEKNRWPIGLLPAIPFKVAGK
ncbi:MAG: DVUA0089 family protein [Verrucomicrobiota bacterium]